MIEVDEKDLIEQAKHDPQAFAALYERYVDRIYAYAYRRTGDQALAQDITSATFEKALRAIHRFEWRGVSIGAWLYRIAHNEMTQHFRRQRFQAPLDLLRAEPHTDDNAYQMVELKDELQTAFSRLAEKDQEILALRFFEELTSAEAAEVLDCTIKNVYLRLHRALKRLRSLVNEVEEMEGERHAAR